MSVTLPNGVESPWDDDNIATLRRLWAEGLSAAEIGRRIGVSKNAVVGKAHRLRLPARPSPLIVLPPGAMPKRGQRRTYRQWRERAAL